MPKSQDTAPAGAYHLEDILGLLDQLGESIPGEPETARRLLEDVRRAIKQMPPALGQAVDEQLQRAGRLSALLTDLAAGKAGNDEGVNPHAILLAAEIAARIADGLDIPNLEEHAAEIDAETPQVAREPLP